MHPDTIVTCMFCGADIRFDESFVMLNGSKPDTYECRGILACDDRRRKQKGLPTWTTS